MGTALVMVDDVKRYAACIGGMVSVVDGKVNLVPTTFEWAENIDTARAELSRQRAEEILKDKTSTDTDIRLAQARLKRALIRKSVANRK
jgi:F-type H+-transporting ATPase subunit epsilon